MSPRFCTMNIVQARKNTSFVRRFSKFIETAVISICMISMFNAVRYVCIVTDTQEPRCRTYRLGSVAAALLLVFFVN